MSQKRKLEEYHDPDYPKLIEPKRICTENLDDKLVKIRSIIVREFQKEMLTKEKEILEIDNRIILIKKLLHQVRYGVVSQYYNKKNLLLNPDDVNLPTTTSLLQNDPIKGKQTAIHPSLKKILGTKLKDYDELLKIRSPRQAAKTAQSTIKEKLKTKKEKRLERLNLEASTTICHQPTTITNKTDEDNSLSINHNQYNNYNKPIATLNEARGGNYIKHLIVVGNTSKYIGFEKSSDNVTHKWLIYVQSKLSTTPPIEQFIRKIRFFLHPSYKPNDIIDVNCSPFQLSRRGWGEFPVRLQLFFHSQLQQKPVQLVHNLILDKKLTGLQTLGAETLVEIWLRSNFLKPTETITKKEYDEKNSIENLINTNSEIENNENMNTILSPTTKTIEKNLMEFLEKIESPLLSSDIDNIEPSLLLSPNQHFNISELMIPTKIERNFDSQFILSENLENITHIEDIKQLPINIQETNNKLNELGICGDLNNDDNYKNIIKEENNFVENNNNKVEIKNNSEQCKLIGNNIENSKVLSKKLNIKSNFSKSNKNNIFFKNGKMYIIDPIQAKLKLKQKYIQQESLLKPQISLLKPQKNNIQLKPINYNYKNPLIYDHDYTPKRNDLQQKSAIIEQTKEFSIFPKNITNNKDFNKIPILIPKKNVCLMRKARYNYRQNIEIEFLAQTFTNCVNAINYLLNKIPLINNLAIQSDYKMSFPFVVQNYDIYKKYNTAKRRANEWLQSKYFSQLMKQHNQFKDNFWTTKEIILYARSHCFTPLITQADNYALKNLLNTTDMENANKQQIDKNSNDFINLDDINKWIKEKMNEIHNKNVKNNQSNEIIDILNDDENFDIKNDKKNITLIKDYSDKFWLPLDEKYDDETTLISNMCFEIGLRLQPEEIQLGVMHESVKLVMIKAMRCFLDELLRKSISKQYEDNCSTSVLECIHIKNAVTSQSRFDFLTNKHLYVTENIKEEELNK